MARAATCGTHFESLGVGRGDAIEHVPPLVGAAVGLGDGDRQRPTRGRHHVAERCRTRGRRRGSRTPGEHAAAPGAHGFGDAHQLGRGRGEGRRRLSAARLVVERARRGEPEGAGGNGLADEVAHGRDLLGRGLGPVGASFAHHVEPERAVGDLGGEVDVVGTAFEGIEVLAERLPLPGEALVQARRRECLRRPPSIR